MKSLKLQIYSFLCSDIQNHCYGPEVKAYAMEDAAIPVPLINSQNFGFIAYSILAFVY